MKVFYLQEELDLSNMDAKGREERLNRVFATLYERNEIVQEVTIDNTVFHEGYENELLLRMQEIQEVRIATINGDVLTQEMLQELHQYLPRVNRAIDSISDLFYGEMTADDWGYFSQLIEGIGWVEKAVNIILLQFNRVNGTEPLQEPFAVFASRIPELLAELEAVLGREDRVAAGDLIKYEFGELLQHLENAIQSRVTV
ncbi:hypothetical protein [Cohnella algarum]|uniref:hypothetical protein n=1 Tax=Cohnella algarum TaxID=2044859 RepID=UPI001966E026|nr:hypothetical protein [Cohnella algarum]MBN2980625.1 hypothetical protein [Cohnella algarum]